MARREEEDFLTKPGVLSAGGAPLPSDKDYGTEAWFKRSWLFEKPKEGYADYKKRLMSEGVFRREVDKRIMSLTPSTAIPSENDNLIEAEAKKRFNNMFPTGVEKEWRDRGYYESRPSPQYLQDIETVAKSREKQRGALDIIRDMDPAVLANLVSSAERGKLSESAGSGVISRDQMAQYIDAQEQIRNANVSNALQRQQSISDAAAQSAGGIAAGNLALARTQHAQDITGDSIRNAYRILGLQQKATDAQQQAALRDYLIAEEERKMELAKAQVGGFNPFTDLLLPVGGTLLGAFAGPTGASIGGSIGSTTGRAFKGAGVMSDIRSGYSRGLSNINLSPLSSGGKGYGY